MPIFEEKRSQMGEHLQETLNANSARCDLMRRLPLVAML
jgi:hypothetical protein